MTNKAETSFTMAPLIPLLGVFFLRVVYANQSGVSIDDQPITSQENGKGQIETPEVVLQLKYDGGELNRIYLAQFRKGIKNWVPSVPAKNALCSDLCHAGLGGTSCGVTCPDLIPVGLNMALSNSSVHNYSVFGEPRIGVCPTLCANNLGQPLCNCQSQEDIQTVQWHNVCRAFCSSGYNLRGCPAACESPQNSVALQSSRILNSADGWIAWCDVQCRQGQGGAACNCDRAPFQ